MNDIGIVVIGRNESRRLERCLRAALAQCDRERVVYVDSGSTDDSIAIARRLDVHAIELDDSKPFNAARGRNAGMEYLTRLHGDVDFIQFVDGDCELKPGWIKAAHDALTTEDRLAVVAGRLRELNPDASVYSRLCDMEWNAPVGEAWACGGVAMMRVRAVQQAGLFDESLMAGEEPELCIRMRGQDWTVRRIAEPMATHDADMTRFGQWWRRGVRGGYGALQNAWLQRHDGCPIELAAMRSIAVWALALPMLAIGLAFVTRGWGLALFLLWPVQMMRIARHRRLLFNDPLAHALIYGAMTMLNKIPQMLGMCKCFVTGAFLKSGAKPKEPRQVPQAATVSQTGNLT